MAFLELICTIRKTTVFLDVRNIVVIEQTKLIPGNKKGCRIYVDKDYDGEGSEYQVHEDPKEIIKKIESLRKSI